MEWNGMEWNGMEWNAMSSFWRHACRARRGARHRHIAPTQRVVGAPPAMLSQTDARRMQGRWLAMRSPLPHWPAKGGNEPIPAATRQPSSSRRREDRRDQTHTQNWCDTRAKRSSSRTRRNATRLCDTRPARLVHNYIILHYITLYDITLHCEPVRHAARSSGGARASAARRAATTRTCHVM